MEPIEFLDTVWGDGEGFVFIPEKGSRWVEGKAYKWPDDREAIADRILKANDRDQYYCPNLFSETERRKEYVLPLRWLYADLDSVNPKKVSLTPTLAVRSSPGRYQALWALKRPISPEKHEEVNRALTYAVGADRGGWDLTQVLRIPGTRNYKYPSRTRVQLAWHNHDSGPYNLKQIRTYLDGVADNQGTSGQAPVPDLILPAESAKELRRRYRDRFDARCKELLGYQEIPEDTGPEGRSGRLWELECLLLESGLEPEEVWVVCKDSVWNKFEGRHDGDLQLWREIQKANLHIGTQRSMVETTDNGSVRLRPRLLTYSDLLSSGVREPEWLVEDWWTLSSHGVIAGLPKSYKSLVTLDLGVSVSSETRFLGQYPVNPKGCGPVLVVQQENSLPLLRDRLYKISHNRGLQTGSAGIEGDNTLVFKLPPAIPLMFYNDFAFDMTMHDDREAIEEIIRNEGIKMVIFDPLYLMIGGADENSAQEMRPILSWLLRIRNLYNCAVVVVHHWGKGSVSRGGRGVGGTRLLGSTTIYGWLEAALYLEAYHQADNSIRVTVEREFRERLSPPPGGYTLNMGDIGDTAYEWAPTGTVGTDSRLIEAIEKAGPKGATLAFLRNQLEIGGKKLRNDLDDLLEEGKIFEEKEGRTKRIYLRE